MQALTSPYWQHSCTYKNTSHREPHGAWSLRRMLCRIRRCAGPGDGGVRMGNEWPGDAAPGGGQPDDVVDLRELEDELCRLTGILGVRIVGDRVGRPVEVHVLADH